MSYRGFHPIPPENIPKQKRFFFSNLHLIVADLLKCLKVLRCLLLIQPDNQEDLDAIPNFQFFKGLLLKPW